MRITRGDVVTVAASGDYGKPRTSVVVQSDVFPAEHASVIVRQMTSTLSDAPDFRVTVEPSARNGLRRTSQIMADKPVTSSATRSQSSLLREPLTTTLNPIDASSLAQARPMLRPDPVISAALLPLAIPTVLDLTIHSSSVFATRGPNSAAASSTNNPNCPSL